MGSQFIFMVETNKQTKSDWIYIKSTIDEFYSYSATQVKLSPVYMGGQGNYLKKEKEAQKLVTKYKAVSKMNQSTVIYCFDCDEYDTEPEKRDFLVRVKKFCDDNGYVFVWFCRDVEHVYLGKQIDDERKKQESITFKKKNSIHNMDIARLLEKDTYKMKSSNLMTVLDGFQEFSRK